VKNPKNLTLPSVHLNGTGRVGLMEQYHKAYMALHEAVVALREATPHNRDYYVQSDEAGPQARKEHQARLAAVEDVMEEIQTIYQSLVPK
jgi:hypothetical protein